VAFLTLKQAGVGHWLRRNPLGAFPKIHAVTRAEMDLALKNTSSNTSNELNGTSVIYAAFAPATIAFRGRGIVAKAIATMPMAASRAFSSNARA